MLGIITALMLHNDSHSSPPSCHVSRSLILGETDEPSQPSFAGKVPALQQLSF